MAAKRAKTDDESLVTFDELFLIRTKLNRERIKLWLPPYTVMVPPSGNQGDIPMEIVSRFSTELSIDEGTVLIGLEKLRSHALAKLKSKETFESTGVCTLNLHLSWVAEGNEKKKIDMPITATLDEEIASVCRRLSDNLQPHKFDFGSAKLIHKGTILKNDKTLRIQNVTNGSNIMVMLALLTSVSEEQGSNMETVNRVHETRKLAEALAKRVDAGTGRRDHYFLEIRNQQGEKINLPEGERQCLSVALTLHEKGRILMKERNFVESLLLFLEADGNFASCSADILKAVDNYALLCLDIVWCYFSLQKLEYLPDAEDRLKKCKECFSKSYGENMERLDIMKGSYMNEMVLFVRLHIMEAISHYLRGNTIKASESLNKAEQQLKNLQIDDDKFTLLISMGYSVTDARLSLRACKGDVTLAIEHIGRKKEQERLRKEQDKKEVNERKITRKYGKTIEGNSIDLEKLRYLEEMGFTTKKAAHALIQSDNDINGALECLELDFSHEYESSSSTSDGSSSSSSSSSNRSLSEREREEDEIDEKVNETLRDISNSESEDYLDLDLNEEAELVNKYRILIASLQQ